MFLQPFPAAHFAPSPGVVSVQHVTITIPTGATSATATINTVDTARSVIFPGGYKTNSSGTNPAIVMPRVELTNVTTVTAYRNTSSGTDTVTVRLAVVHFSPAAVSLVQHGSIGLSTVQTSNTATITSVNTSLSAVVYLGNISSHTGSLSPDRIYGRVELTNGTTVTAARGSSSSTTMTVGFAVITFTAAYVNSIQQGAITSTSSATSNTGAISSVNTANSMLLWGGTSTGSTSTQNATYRTELTNGTTVTATRTGTSTLTRTINFTVIEFKAGVLKSAQRGTGSMSAATSANSTISSVNTARSVPSYCGASTLTASGKFDDWASVTYFGNATTLTSEKNTAGSSSTVTSWEAIEFA